MGKLKLSREIMILGILTVLTVFTWMSFDIYRVLRRPAAPKVPTEQLAPLDPKLDTNIIQNLSQREALEKGEFVAPIQAPVLTATAAAKPNKE